MCCPASESPPECRAVAGSATPNATKSNTTTTTKKKRRAGSLSACIPTDLTVINASSGLRLTWRTMIWASCCCAMSLTSERSRCGRPMSSMSERSRCGFSCRTTTDATSSEVRCNCCGCASWKSAVRNSSCPNSTCWGWCCSSSTGRWVCSCSSPSPIPASGAHCATA